MNVHHPSRRSSVAVIGLGLIGGSLALALRRRGWRVTGTDVAPRALREARRRGALDVAARSVAAATRGARLVVLAVPVQAMDRCLRDVAAVASRDAVVTDTASVKGPVAEAARRRLPSPSRFVGGHPMAGSERSGIAAARADLFRGRTCVVTPHSSAPGAVAAVARMWRACGARVVRMRPVDHDRVVARVSHHPHLLAFTLALALRDPWVHKLAAGSFLDATRVAASSPGLWAGILRANRGLLSAAAAEAARRQRLILRAAARAEPSRLVRLLRSAARLRRTLRDDAR